MHVIINDGGAVTDVDRLVKKYMSISRHPIKVIHNAKSLGMESASNKAIKSVSSQYIAIHDDDDSWHPDFLNQTVGFLDKHLEYHGIMVTTDRIKEIILGDKSVQEVDRERWKKGIKVPTLYELAHGNFLVPISFLYRRSVFDSVGYYDETLPVCGDWDFALRFLMKYDIYFLRSQYALAYYHVRPNVNGALGNSIYDKSMLFEQTSAKLKNRYLRDPQYSAIGLLLNQPEDNNLLHDEVTNLSLHLDNIEEIIMQRTDYRRRVKNLMHKTKVKLRKVVKGR